MGREVGMASEHDLVITTRVMYRYRGTMSVTCSPIWRSLAEVSSSITCPACVCTFTRLVSVSTATTVASTVPIPCPEVPLAPGRSSLLAWMSIIDREGICTSTILPSLSVTCQVCAAPSTCTTVARSGCVCPKALGGTSVVIANTTPSRRRMPEQAWRCIVSLLSVTRNPQLRHNRIAHEMKADIIRWIKEECEIPPQAHHTRGDGLAIPFVVTLGKPSWNKGSPQGKFGRGDVLVV